MEEVIRFLRNNQERFIQELCEYLKFPSVSAQSEHNADTAACADWIAEHCKKTGLAVKVYKTKTHPIVIAKTDFKK